MIVPMYFVLTIGIITYNNVVDQSKFDSINISFMDHDCFIHKEFNMHGHFGMYHKMLYNYR